MKNRLLPNLLDLFRLFQTAGISQTEKLEIYLEKHTKISPMRYGSAFTAKKLLPKI